MIPSQAPERVIMGMLITKQARRMSMYALKFPFGIDPLDVNKLVRVGEAAMLGP